MISIFVHCLTWKLSTNTTRWELTHKRIESLVFHWVEVSSGIIANSQIWNVNNLKKSRTLHGCQVHLLKVCLFVYFQVNYWYILVLYKLTVHSCVLFHMIHYFVQSYTIHYYREVKQNTLGTFKHYTTNAIQTFI